MNMKFFINEKHGGNIYSFSEESGIDVRDVIDFSASINPLGPPSSVIEEISESLRLLRNYPDPEARELSRVLGEFHGISPYHIICGNGCTEMIYLTMRALHPLRILLPVPTFSEYERAWLLTLRQRGKDGKLKLLELKEEEGFVLAPDSYMEAMKGCDMAFLCNPNNPTGRMIKRDDLLEIADTAREYQCHLVVDEAFIDFCPGESVIDMVPENPFLIVLRSMTKFYALPGLRLGYGAFPYPVLHAIREVKEPWTVNTLAMKAGVRALRDEEYMKITLELIREEKNFLEQKFRELKIRYIDSDANFYLLKVRSSAEVMGYLAEKGILVRNCENFFPSGGSYIRIAVKKRKENEIIIKELAACERNCNSRNT